MHVLRNLKVEIFFFNFVHSIIKSKKKEIKCIDYNIIFILLTH